MNFITIFNEKIDIPCAGCLVKDNTKFKEGRIYQSKLWDLSQDFEIAYPGMIVLSPLHGLIEVKDKYSILGELRAKVEDLRPNKENMLEVVKTIGDFREYFRNIEVF